MPDAEAQVADELRAIPVHKLGILRALGTGGPGHVLGVLQPHHSRPLLQLLVGALRVDKVISQPMGNQHSRSTTTVCRIGVFDEAGPIIGRMLQTLGTGLVTSVRSRVAERAGKARERHARVGGAGGENVRVGPDHHRGHHAARRTAHDEDARSVSRVPRQGVLDGADDARCVARSAVREGPCVVDVPAVAVSSGARIDENEAARVGGSREGLREPPLARAAAGVKLARSAAGGEEKLMVGGFIHTPTMMAGFDASLSGT